MSDATAPTSTPEGAARLALLEKMHIPVLRACYALGEQGDWDVEALQRELTRQMGISMEEAAKMVEAAVQDGAIAITEPAPKAEVIDFAARRRQKAG